ncbi:MAG: cupin domain-containing protein [Pseudomonadota bacterium]
MTDPGPHHLAAQPVIMQPTGEAVPKPFSPSFFAELETDFPDFQGHTLVMTSTYEEAWSTWEIHPHGDELVYLLEGDIDFVLHTDEGDVTLRVNEPGSYVVVPRNTWHTARPRTRTRMLFVTPGEGTRNQPEPD